MPYSHFNNSKVDLRSRIAMTNYLGCHWRYGKDYAWNVKITHLNIPDELEFSAYAILEDDYSFLDVNNLITLFEAYHDGVTVGFDGRQNGYMIMHGAEDDQNFATWDMAELRRVVRLVRAFDGLVDDCVALFMDYAETYLTGRREEARFAGAHDKAYELRFDLGMNDLPEYHAGYELSQAEAQAYLDDLDGSAAFDAGREDALSGDAPDVGSLDANSYTAGYAAGKVDAATIDAPTVINRDSWLKYCDDGAAVNDVTYPSFQAAVEAAKPIARESDRAIDVIQDEDWYGGIQPDGTVI